jgi:nicotinate-nucleotide adenylyltransferase
MKRIILFGGTFDPVHVGHTTVVEHVAATLRASDVVFIPARRSPHKSDVPLAPSEQRLAMLTLALADHPSFTVSRCELDRPEPSYTIDTVMEFRRQFPDARLSLVIGADAISSLPRWYRIGDLLDLCEISVMSRGGVDSPEFDRLVPSLGIEAASRLRESAIATPLIPVSSTEIRARLAAGQDVSSMLHPAVLTYIRCHGLYGAKG